MRSWPTCESASTACRRRSGAHGWTGWRGGRGWPPAQPDAAELGRRLAAGDRTAGPAALNVIEDRSPAGRERAAALLAEVGAADGAHLVGVTGPPGAGKSSLLSALVASWRAEGRTAPVPAGRPASERGGGGLLRGPPRSQDPPRGRRKLIPPAPSGRRL